MRPRGVLRRYFGWARRLEVSRVEEPISTWVETLPRLDRVPSLSHPVAALRFLPPPALLDGPVAVLSRTYRRTTFSWGRWVCENL